MFEYTLTLTAEDILEEDSCTLTPEQISTYAFQKIFRKTLENYIDWYEVVGIACERYQRGMG
jgi:hypothetical protein